MAERKSTSNEPRTWAIRDRARVPTNRTRGRRMRLEPTEAERKLWWHLRYRLALPNSHFRRQVQLGRYIVDFASHGLKIVIEIDGGQHASHTGRDAGRTTFLELEGYRFMRFWNNEVLGNIDGVLAMIQNSILATPTSTPPHKGEGSR
jgi:very-short-patch-repair endonuclease